MTSLTIPLGVSGQGCLFTSQTNELNVSIQHDMATKYRSTPSNIISPNVAKLVSNWFWQCWTLFSGNVLTVCLEPKFFASCDQSHHFVLRLALSSGVFLDLCFSLIAKNAVRPFQLEIHEISVWSFLINALFSSLIRWVRLTLELTNSSYVWIVLFLEPQVPLVVTNVVHAWTGICLSRYLSMVLSR